MRRASFVRGVILDLHGTLVAPSVCIAFEDSANGVAAARAAGINVAAAPSRFTSAGELGDADQVLQSFADCRWP